MKTIIVFVIIYFLFSLLMKKVKPKKEQAGTPHHEPTRHSEPSLETEPAPAQAESKSTERDSFMDLMGMGPEPEPEPESKPEPQPWPIRPTTGPVYTANDSQPTAPPAPEFILNPVMSQTLSASDMHNVRVYRHLTPGKLREGIILAEILGPCLANRRPEQQVGYF